jgi:rhodanese-related sulfurtransferase
MVRRELPGQTLDMNIAAAEHFRSKLAFETDASDVAAALDADIPQFVLIDSRGQAAWDQGHIPEAVHLPTARVASEAAALIPAGTPVVTYCWGPGCNGATRAALEFALLGYEVREMIGGFEYWVREGLDISVGGKLDRRLSDPLTAPSGVPVCDC